MKAIKLFAAACIAVLMCACGTDNKAKDLEIDTKFTGREASSIDLYSHLIEIVNEGVPFTMEVKDNDGHINEDWTLKVKVKVISDECKGIPASEIEKKLPELTAEVVNANGEVVVGQVAGCKLKDDNLKQFCELLSQGTGAEGVITFTYNTGNKDKRGEWFEQAKTVRLVPGYMKGSNNTSSTVSGPASSDEEIVGGPAIDERPAGYMLDDDNDDEDKDDDNEADEISVDEVSVDAF